MSPVPTIRTLAAQLNLSVATVSEALRDIPRVNAATRSRVKRAAARAGYRPNRLLGEALSAIRRSSHRAFRGTLAIVELVENDRTEMMLFHREILAGAQARAGELGFTTELFWLGTREVGLPLARLQTVLSARGIDGVVLLPFNVPQDLGAFDFSRFSVVQMDHCLLRPQLHTILPDHYISMIHALERLTGLGYQRIGLVLDRRKDLFVQNKWSAAFLSFYSAHNVDAEIPALIGRELDPDRFLEWYRLHKPDLVVGHQQRIIDWLADAGVRVPRDVGFFNLNLTERTGPCSGLDLLPRGLGAAAIEKIVGMLHRQERGVPLHPQTTTLEAAWVDGPTLRRRRGRS